VSTVYPADHAQVNAHPVSSPHRSSAIAAIGPPSSAERFPVNNRALRDPPLDHSPQAPPPQCRRCLQSSSADYSVPHGTSLCDQ
jgi:hypothetical protein